MTYRPYYIEKSGNTWCWIWLIIGLMLSPALIGIPIAIIALCNVKKPRYRVIYLDEISRYV